MGICPYCAQFNTHKDQFGYCKKYNCFYVSGVNKIYENLKYQYYNLIFISKCKRNQFDGNYYNPREDERKHILNKVQKLLGFIPLDFLKR